MSQASHTSEIKSPTFSTTPTWLNRARIISALAYILILIGYLIFIIVCIARYPSCERAPSTPWWFNSVFLRLSTRTLTFNDIQQKLNDYQSNFSLQALWLNPVMRLSAESNPLAWNDIEMNLGGESALMNLINKSHESDLRIIVDYPLNHLSIQSPKYLANDDSYFVWNDQGNLSNWVTVDNPQKSAWTYNNRKNSFYLHQFDRNSDAIDVNYRNNRVFKDVINSLSSWDTKYLFDGFNIQGISYAYEDYEYQNEDVNGSSRTRHLDEDYLLLARIKSEINPNKLLLLDSVDSLSTSNDQILTRYYGDENKSLGGVQIASINDYILTDAHSNNVTGIFHRYSQSIFFQRNQPLIWSSLSSNSQLNEAFFAACLFHVGVVAIDLERQGQQFTTDQLSRLRQISTFVRTLDVFRAGRIQQNILSDSKLLTIERARRGSRHHIIIINLSNTVREDKIELKEGNTNAVEVLLTNLANPGVKYETNALLDMTETIRLEPYEYIILRWSPSIDGLGIIF
ncbi:unnamed protein product [Adineta ricciae]|uniref:Glycosyl hydrolase family 13 catalytic domain-containing protein n=1 Tax=Adineta ricciae TaxID=249248 RepID=A0A814YJ79_ADIRI|nr:unnamed protein product [Adineta ricciae]CAF1440698.1 unnamed protein product [Adineta ricciae]